MELRIPRLVTIAMNKGFTLTELVVYITLLSIIVVAVIQIVFVILDANVRGAAREEVLTNSIRAVDAIRKEVREAQTIYTSTSVFASHPGQLSLVSTSNVPTDELVTYVDFFLSDDGRLCVKREEQVHQCITSPLVTITDLRFVHLFPVGGPEAIQTFITLERQSSRSQLKASYTIQSTDIIREF